MNGIALLAGLFVPPVYLLVLGHHFRDATPRRKSIFWGCTVGWLTAVVVVAVAWMANPVLWPGAGLRTFAVYWGLLAGAGVGALIGAVRPAR